MVARASELRILFLPFMQKLSLQWIEAYLFI